MLRSEHPTSANAFVKQADSAMLENQISRVMAVDQILNIGDESLLDSLEYVAALTQKSERSAVENGANVSVENNAKGEFTYAEKGALKTLIDSARMDNQKSLVGEFTSLQSVIGEARSDIRQLQELYRDTKDDLERCKMSTTGVLQQAEELISMKSLAHQKMQICSALVAKLQVPSAVVAQLTSPNVPVDAEFFKSIEIIKNIRRRGRLLARAVDDSHDFPQHAVGTGGNSRRVQSNPQVSTGLNTSEGAPHHHLMDSSATSKDASFPESDATAHTKSLAGTILTDDHHSSTNYSLGSDVVAFITEILDLAHDKLFHWVENHFRSMAHSVISATDLEALDLLSSPPSGTENNSRTAVGDGLLRSALSEMKSNPAYFKLCAKDIARVRRHVLLHSFYSALTRGGPNSNPRPIELYAADIARYSSDMLAWIHQRTAAEIEFVTGLLDVNLRTGSDNDDLDAKDDPLDSNWDMAKEFQVSPLHLLNTIFGGLCEPLSIRVKQSLANTASSLATYRVAQLLDFYQSTLDSVCQRVMDHTADNVTDAGTDSTFVLVTVCRELKEQALSTFLGALQDQAGQVQALPYTSIYTSDLSPPVVLIDSLNYVREICKVYDSSLVDPLQKEEEFTPILDATLNPVLQACRRAGTWLGEDDSCIFLINCFAYAQRELMRFHFTARRAELLALLFDDEMRKLTGNQIENLLKSCGLQKLLVALRSRNPEDPLDTNPLLQPHSISTCVSDFFNQMFSVGTLNLPIVDKISFRTERADARHTVAKGLLTAYRELYDSAKGAYNNDVLSLRSPDQLVALLELV
eukprot:Lankesteria_metandrocarpae@DN2363_c0_g1_i1.p1